MLVKCIKNFRDLEANVMRNVGDTFDVTDERAAAINSTHYGKLVEEVVVEVTEETPETEETTEEVAEEVSEEPVEEPVQQPAKKRGRPRKE